MAMERENRAPAAVSAARSAPSAWIRWSASTIRMLQLRRYTSERGKILPRRTTGTCAVCISAS